MSRIKTHVKVNDQVVVISGEHKTAPGKVLQVLPKKQQVLIEGVRMIKKHAKKSQDRPDGGIIELEGPIHLSNVKKIESKAPKADSSKPEQEAPQESDATDNS